MQIHASCAARDGAAVLVTGPSGSGKSDLVLRLLDHGFILVADDQVVIAGNQAQAPEPLKGLLEVRGLGIVRLEHLASAPIRMVAQLIPWHRPDRLPLPHRHETFGVPVMELDPFEPSAPAKIAMALRCATGSVGQVAGAFAA